MAVAGSTRQLGNSWIMWAFWAAGFALLLVELNAGMEYLEAGLQQNMVTGMGYIAAVGMITLNVAQGAIWHWGTLEPVLRAVPIAALGLLLVALSLRMNKHTASARGQGARQ